jgi:hypothetical protein
MLKHYPNQRVSRASKTKKWRRDTVDYISQQADSFYDSDYKRMFENYLWYNDQVIQEEFRAWCDPLGLDRGASKDYVHAFNMSHNKIKKLQGEELQRPFNYGAVSTNPRDHSQVAREKQLAFRRYIEFELTKEVQKYELNSNSQDATNSQRNRMAQEMQQQQEALAQEIMDPERIKKKFRNYRLSKETLANKILRQYELYHRIKLKKNESFMHQLISGIEAVMVEEVNGEAKVTPLNSLGVFFHKGPEQPFIQDGEYAGYKREMTYAEVMDTYGNRLAKKDLDRLKNYLGNVYGLDAKLYSRGGYSPSHWEHVNYKKDFYYGTEDVLHSGSYGQGRSYDDYVTVYTVYWRSWREVGFLEYTDEYGEERKELVDEGFPIPEDAEVIKIKTRKGATMTRYEWTDELTGQFYSMYKEWIPEIWTGTRIEEDIYVDIEPLYYNQPTIWDPYNAKLPIFGYQSEARNAPIVSVFDRMKPWQKLYYFTMSKFLKLLGQDKSIVTLLNVLMLDPELGIERTIQYMTDMGIMPYNPLAHEKGEQLAHNMKPAEEINLSNSSELAHYVTLLQFIENKIGDAAGVPKAREGQTARGTNVTDNRQDIIESAIITEPLFYMHDILWEDVLNCVLKISVDNIDEEGIINRYILSDDEVAIIELAELNKYDNFEVKITSSGKQYQILEQVKAQAQALIQNDKIQLSQLIELLGTDNLSEFKAYIAEIEEDIARREEAMKQAQLQTRKEITQMQTEDREDKQAHEHELQERRYDREEILEQIKLSNQPDEITEVDDDSIEREKLALMREEKENKNAIEQRKLDQKDREIAIKDRQARAQARKAVQNKQS